MVYSATIVTVHSVHSNYAPRDAQKSHKCDFAPAILGFYVTFAHIKNLAGYPE